MPKTVPLDKQRELLYKSFELHPLPKLSVETGDKATIQILNRLEYLTNLAIPKNLSWMGYDRTVSAMDRETALLVRDHPVFSTVKRIAAHGTARQYGEKVPEESKIGAASAIALVQETEDGDIQITRKKEVGLDNKHSDELIREFHDVDMEKPIFAESDKARMVKAQLKTESLPPPKQEPPPPPLKKEEKPKLKKDEIEEYVVPW